MRRLHRWGVWPEDLAVLPFLAGTAAIALVLGHRRPGLWYGLAHHYVYIGGWTVLALFLTTRSFLPVLPLARRWLPYFVLLNCYEDLEQFIHLLSPLDRDDWLIRADLWLFGSHPSVWLERFVTPWLTRLLHSAYTFFYLIGPLGAGLLWFRGKRRAFHDMMLATMLGFYLCYLGYLLVPAIGPRFTLSHLYSLEMAGSSIIEHIQYQLDGLESTLRDCFPSAHTAVSVIVLEMLRRHERRAFWVGLPIVAALLFACVYGRYHYVVDILAGLGVTAGCVWAAPRINLWWERTTGVSD